MATFAKIRNGTDTIIRNPILYGNLAPSYGRVDTVVLSAVRMTTEYGEVFFKRHPDRDQKRWINGKLSTERICYRVPMSGVYIWLNKSKKTNRQDNELGRTC